MPALNFKMQFADAVATGTKRQTIRVPWKNGENPFRTGCRLFLYTGMRTKNCRKLGEAICTKCHQIKVTTDQIFVDGMAISNTLELALADGFKTLVEILGVEP